jgi:ArsR family metal-binding transcriptional regulator
MLIESHRLEIFTPPCDPGSERYTAIAHFEVDISGVMPYLNATLVGASYHPAARALMWKRGGHAVAFHAHDIGVSNVEDRQAAAEELEDLIRIVNQTWNRRGEVIPDHTAHRRPTLMEVYRQLPKTNCRECGEPTCYTFALKLIAGMKAVADCPPLAEWEFSGQLAALQAMLPT